MTTPKEELKVGHHDIYTERELRPLAEILFKHKHGGLYIYPGDFDKQSDRSKEFFYGIAERIMLAGYQRVT